MWNLGYRPRPQLGHPALVPTAKLAGPMVVLVAASVAFQAFGVYLATQFKAVAQLNYAFAVFSLPLRRLRRRYRHGPHARALREARPRGRRRLPRHLLLRVQDNGLRRRPFSGRHDSARGPDHRPALRARQVRRAGHPGGGHAARRLLRGPAGLLGVLLPGAGPSTPARTRRRQPCSTSSSSCSTRPSPTGCPASSGSSAWCSRSP